jgi:ABC-type Zn uptake system ZnuABC Zn-binding protein ZnuA
MKPIVKSLVPVLAVLTLLLYFQSAHARQIRIVATTTDLADLAKAVGGDRISVTSLAQANQDVHLIEPRPSQVSMLRDADLFVKIGMDLDQWSQALLDAARNKSIRYGGPGYVDCSVRIHRLEVPKERVDPSKGEWHAFGNPHYWLDPANAEIMTADILDGVKRVSPADADYFERNRDAFLAHLRSAIKRWQDQMAPFKGCKIVTYHRAWTYFVRRFGLEVLGCVEPKPGIPPTASHVVSLTQRIRAEKQRVLILSAPFYPDAAPRAIAARTGARFLVVPWSVGGAKGADNFILLFGNIIDALAKGFSGQDELAPP